MGLADEGSAGAFAAGAVCVRPAFFSGAVALSSLSPVPPGRDILGASVPTRFASEQSSAAALTERPAPARPLGKVPSPGLPRAPSELLCRRVPRPLLALSQARVSLHGWR